MKDICGMLVVLSVVHGVEGRDHTFVHGVFQDEFDAKMIADEVEKDRSYIEEEGYDMDEVAGVTVHISVIPAGIRVNEYVPKIM
jgi:hypothetical protein